MKTQNLEHDFNLKVRDNKLKAIVGTTMFRTRTEANAKAYKRRPKHKEKFEF